VSGLIANSNGVVQEIEGAAQIIVRILGILLPPHQRKSILASVPVKDFFGVGFHQRPECGEGALV